MFRNVLNWLFRTKAGAGAAAPRPRRCESCPKPQSIHITLMWRGSLEGEKHLCEDCAQRFLAPARAPEVREPSDRSGTDQEVRIEITRVIISENHDEQVIVFQEVGGPRSFPFVCGIFEATAIDRTLKQVPSPRPLTHDAWLATLAALGANVQAACVRELRERTYHATLRLDQAGQLVEVDLRPSDAVHMALKAKAPIVIPKKLLAEVSSADHEPV
jgi:bifunctional DNase/RNase